MEILKLLIWIATLYGCLQASPITGGDARGCKKGSLKLREMKNLKCEQNSTFYTPIDAKPECLTAALDCVMTELQTAKLECDDPDEYMDQGIECLKRMVSSTKTHVLDSNDCLCEKWPTTNFTMFLNTLEVLSDLKSSLELQLVDATGFPSAVPGTLHV